MDTKESIDEIPNEFSNRSTNEPTSILLSRAILTPQGTPANSPQGSPSNSHSNSPSPTHSNAHLKISPPNSLLSSSSNSPLNSLRDSLSNSPLNSPRGSLSNSSSPIPFNALLKVSKEEIFELDWQLKNQIINQLINHTEFLYNSSLLKDIVESLMKKNFELIQKLKKLSTKLKTKFTNPLDLGSLDRFHKLVLEIDYCTMMRLIEILSQNNKSIITEINKEEKERLIEENNNFVQSLVLSYPTIGMKSLEEIEKEFSKNKSEVNRNCTEVNRIGLNEVKNDITETKLKEMVREQFLNILKDSNESIFVDFLRGFANKICTFSITGKNIVNQKSYYCSTCGLIDDICVACADLCHKGHNLKLKPGSPCFCECGESLRNCKAVFKIFNDT